MVFQSTEVLTTTGKVKKHGNDEGKVWPQILAIFIVSLGSLSSGLIVVWSSPFSLVVTQDKVNYDITEDEASYFIIFHPLGMIFASVAFYKISELLGRKKFLLLVGLPHIVSWIVTATARTKWEFYIARFLSGIGDSCLFCSIPPYIGEITIPVIRGYWGNTPTCFGYVGQLLITILGSYLGVKTTAYICITVPILFLLLVSFLPESPYQLIRDHKYEEARQSIKWLRRKVNIEEDFQSMKADVESQMSQGVTWKDLFTNDNNKKALRAGIFLRLSQQLSGIGVFISYGQVIFAKAGGSVNPIYASIIFMSIAWLLNLLSSAAVEKFGRKPSYFYSSMGTGVILMIMALYFFLDQYQLANLEQFQWFPLAGMIGYLFTYSFGLGIVPTLMLGELFSASIKSKGLCILMILFGIGGFLTSNVYKLLSNFGLYTPFIVYSICCLVSTKLTLLWVPETKGKTLEEIQQSLKK